MIITKHITFLNRRTWHFNLFCLLFNYVMLVYCVCFMYFSSRSIRARIRMNMTKNKEMIKICTHDVHHGACHDVATMTPPSIKEKSKGQVSKIMVFAIRPWHPPWTLSPCSAQFELMAFSMESAMGFKAWKITTKSLSFFPLQHIFLPLLQHEFQTFSTRFSYINRPRF